MKAGKNKQVYRYRLGVVAGTFSRFHAGHAWLLETAFSKCEKVIVCITTQSYAAKLNKHHPVEDYGARVKNVVRFLHERGLLERAIIYPLEDFYGPAIVRPDIEALFASEETFLGALKVLKERIRRGLKNMDLVVVSLLLAENGRPVKSTRIWHGEIDEYGRTKLK